MTVVDHSQMISGEREDHRYGEVKAEETGIGGHHVKTARHEMVLRMMVPHEITGTIHEICQLI